MLFRQIFDVDSCTYTYLIASDIGREAIIIDPVKQKIDQYIKLFSELDLKLVVAIDTHVHADHITALGPLRETIGCDTVLGEQTKAEFVSLFAKEGEIIKVDGIEINPIYTPGHTDDSYSFIIDNKVFTGDTLLIRSTGRTDFQNGDAFAQYDSIFNKLLKLDDNTIVYPAHDYQGFTASTIWEEKKFNSRLQVSCVQEYIDIMNNLNLKPPRIIDIAVPANLKLGLGE